jgi:hypothetical protein
MRKAGVNSYTAYVESGLVADVSDTIKLDEEQKIKDMEFELKMQEELEKIKQKFTEKSVDDKKADGSNKTETVDEP